MLAGQVACLHTPALSWSPWSCVNKLQAHVVVSRQFPPTSSRNVKPIACPDKPCKTLQTQQKRKTSHFARRTRCRLRPPRAAEWDCSDHGCEVGCTEKGLHGLLSRRLWKGCQQTLALLLALGLQNELIIEPAYGDIPVVKEAVIDGANVIPRERQEQLERQIQALEEESGWKIRVVTRYGQGAYPSADEIRATWALDDYTLVVLEDITSPNIFQFFPGIAVQRQKLPRQFFIELQSRFGNQFFVQEEGDLEALTQTVSVLRSCLAKEGGCRFVPGLTDELYWITLATSLVGGAVFGFAARQESTDRIAYSWQWVLLFSPLWGILLISFGTLPVTARTSDLEPLIKNYVGFLFGAAAVYLTPILGQTDLPAWLSKPSSKPGESSGKADEDEEL